ncbi:unnamed protein product, partial [Staurois parvus]
MVRCSSFNRDWPRFKPSMGRLIVPNLIVVRLGCNQERTNNSWGPRAIGDHGAPVSLPTLKAHPKKPIQGTRGISWGPLLTPGPRAVPEFPN